MAQSFDDLVKRTSTRKVRDRAARRTRELLRELMVGEVRQLAGKTQRETADLLRIKQPSLSKLEKQSDMQISTLRRIVSALGGELELVAKFPKGSVKIGPLGRDQRVRSHRVAERDRGRVVAAVARARSEFSAGQCRPKTAAQIVREARS